MKPARQEVTDCIRQRNAPLRATCLARVAHMAARPRGSDRVGSANAAHAVATMPANDKLKIVAERVPHIAVVMAYNDIQENAHGLGRELFTGMRRYVTSAEQGA